MDYILEDDFISLSFKVLTVLSILNNKIIRSRFLWVDSVSPRMKAIVSRERFKPIRIGANLVVNYNLCI